MLGQGFLSYPEILTAGKIYHPYGSWRKYKEAIEEIEMHWKKLCAEEHSLSHGAVFLKDP